MGWVANMTPLPDAERSKRVYTLLQNLDLENVSQANLASVGDPISIEKLNEDELRRLVLVNLARLSVKGEWNGLLTAASGGGGVEVLGAELGSPSTYKHWNVCAMPPYGSAKIKSNGKTDQKGMFFPFISPQSGSLASMRMRINTAVAGGGFFVGIYSADENTFVPKDLIGYAEFATDSTGNLEVTSFSSTITLTRGTYYWMYSNADSATTATNCVFYANEMATGTAVPSLGGPYDTISTQPVGVGLRYSSNNTGTPESSITASDLEGSFPFGATQTGDPPTILLAWT